MAKVIYTEKTNSGKAEYVDAAYDGKTHRIEVYGGDTRTDAEKLAAIKLCLELQVKDLALKEGKPLPEADK